jgi:DNA (cytosine-5)-methyltransferase 1
VSKLNYKLVNFCEFDSYATKSYCAIHNVDESLNLGDITKVDETKLEPFNMICGGSPCQDFSLAGKRNGSVWTCKDCGHEYNPLTVHWSKRDKCPCCDSENIEKTRSSLLVEYLRIIRANKPNFGIYENVKNIVGKQFKETTFKLFEEELHEYGYNTYWKVLNSKDYGIPQSRERVYLIFIKKELDNGKFVFPKGFNNGICLKDVLEDEVDEKFYLTDSNIKTYSREFGSKGKQLDLNGISPTLTASMGTGGGNMPYFENKTNKRLINKKSNKNSRNKNI